MHWSIFKGNDGLADSVVGATSTLGGSGTEVGTRVGAVARTVIPRAARLDAHALPVASAQAAIICKYRVVAGALSLLTPAPPFVPLGAPASHGPESDRTCLRR